jgi:hypothetical protein
VSDRNVDTRQVRDEHLAEVNQAAHWAYLAAVLAGGLVLMLGLIALLGATTV